MKSTNTYLLFLFFIVSNFLMAQVEVIWSDPVEIYSGIPRSPRIAMLGDGSPSVIWGGAGDILFSRHDGTAFTAPATLSTNTADPDIYTFAGIDIATHNDHIFIVFEDFDDGVFLLKSADGGQTFLPPVNVYNPDPGKWATLSSVAVDDNGNPLVSVILENTNETQGQYILMHSTDAGASFSPPVIASEPANGDFVCECCPSDIYTSDDNVWLVFRNNDNNLRDTWVSKSSDGGQTFTQALDVDASDWMINICPISGPKIAGLANDSLVTFWNSGATGENRVSISTFHGMTMEKGFEMAFPQDNPNASQTHPDLAGNQDTIGIVWEENGFGTNTSDIRFAFSTAGTASLLTNLSNVTPFSGTQRYPSLAYANGVFHLIYTESGGGLFYSSGTLSAITENLNPDTQHLSIDIIGHPITTNTIQLKITPPPINKPIHARLIDLAGNTLQKWNPQFIDPNGILKLKTPLLPTGLYFISLSINNQVWSEKIVIQD